MNLQVTQLKTPLLFIALLSVIFILNGCAGSANKYNLQTRYDLADAIARSGGLSPSFIDSEPFILKSYSRIERPSGDKYDNKIKNQNMSETDTIVIQSDNQVLNADGDTLTPMPTSSVNHTAVVYIEGDGLSWISRRQISPDPTPTYPLALDLAQADRSANVIYLARPCQYTRAAQTSRCNQKYWTSHRFHEHIIDSYQDALNQLKKQNNLDGFHLVGFSGGGAVASLLAAKRNDVLSLRTVAGNLDHVALNNHHRVSQMKPSLNAIDYAQQLSDVPQIHYYGGKDNIVIPQISESFIQVQSPSANIKRVRVDNASHEDGWVTYWQSEHIAYN